MSRAWMSWQVDEARLIWRHAVAQARWHDAADDRFRHWVRINEQTRAILLASRAGLPADLIAIVSGIEAKRLGDQLRIGKSLCRLPCYGAAAAALTEKMPAFGLRETAGGELATHH